MVLPLNKLIDNRYIISQAIGYGGMCEIYEAIDTFYHRPVAIKILQDRLNTPENEERFLNEINYSSMFSSKRIIEIYNIGYYNGKPFASCELFKGELLKDLIDRRSKLTVSESINFFIQILKAVKIVHEHEITHNDLKPDNIYVEHDGMVKLFDFGIATHVGDPAKSKILASAQYVAPEVIQEKRYTVKSDIYSLGIIFYEFIVGKTPFMKRSVKDEILSHANDKIPSVKGYVNDKYVDDFDYIIRKCTDKNVNRRYNNCSEILKDVIAIKEGTFKRGGFFERLFKR